MAMAVRKESIKFLKRQIDDKMVQSESLHRFFPEIYLNVIFTLDDIRRAVDELACPTVEKTGLAQTIHDKGIRMFAILIKNGEEDLITKFRKHEVLDAQLPLSEDRAKSIAGDFGISFAQTYQREFLPYKFPRDMRDYHRHINNSERILPFIGEPENFMRGGFGDISRVTILHSQQEFVLDKVYSHLPPFVLGGSNTDILTEQPNPGGKERNKTCKGSDPRSIR